MLLNITSLIIGLLGALGTVYFGLKAKKLEKNMRSFGWNEITNGIKYIANQSKKFDADVILSFSGPGAIISNLLMTETTDYIPLYLGLSEKSDGDGFSTKPPYNKFIETKKWRTYIPDSFFTFRDNKILICDDSVISGDTLERIIELLLENGFKRENILTASLFVSKVAVDSNKAPDLFWYKTTDHDFYLPWGRSIRKGY